MENNYLYKPVWLYCAQLMDTDQLDPCHSDKPLSKIRVEEYLQCRHGCCGNFFEIRIFFERLMELVQVIAIFIDFEGKKLMLELVEKAVVVHKVT